MIKAPDVKSLEFIDQLLWRFPIDSFLPHIIKDTSCKDYIVITTSRENPNNASAIFNLTKDPIDLSKNSFNRIFEFEDLSNKQKVESAKNRFDHYKSKGYTIIAY